MYKPGKYRPPPCDILFGAESFAGCSALREIEGLIIGRDAVKEITRRAMGHPGAPKAYVHQFKTNTFENVFKGTPFLEQEKGSRCMYCGWKLSFFKKCKNKHCDGAAQILT
jgi:hypothetical protein